MTRTFFCPSANVFTGHNSIVNARNRKTTQHQKRCVVLFRQLTITELSSASLFTTSFSSFSFLFFARFFICSSAFDFLNDSSFLTFLLETF